MFIRFLTLCFCCLMAFPSILKAQRAARLSDMAEVSVVTCAPGTEVYELFGHCAFRVRDPQLRLDKAYNYGTFEFGPGFELQFVRGKLRYFLNSYSFKRFMVEYEHYNRTVKEQVLNLTQDQKQAIFDYLINNERPENRDYQYDFFYDNCATRERDVIGNVLGDQLKYETTGPDTFGTLRDMIHIYLSVAPWTSFGIDMFLGMPADKVADKNASMFLPDYLFTALQTGKVNVNGQWQALVASERVLFQAPSGSAQQGGWFSPLIFCWLLFGIGAVLTFTQFGRKRAFRLFDSLLFFVVGILGIIMLMFMVATDHQATYWNLNLLWALPTHLVFAFLLWRRKADWWIFYYASYAGLAHLVFLLTNWFLPQDFHPAVYPVVLLMLFRLMLYRFRSIE